MANVENCPVAGWEMGNFCGKYCAQEGDMGRLTGKQRGRAGSHPQGDAKIYGRLPTKICYSIHHEAFGTVKIVPYRAFYSGQPTIKQPVGRGYLTPPELCLVASENWRKEQEKKKACAPFLKDVSTCLFLFL